MFNLSDSSHEFLTENPRQRRKLALALVGAVLLVIGVFLPIVSMPMVGSINYFNNGRGDGIIIIALAAVTAALALAKKFKFVTFVGLASLALITYTLFRLLSGLNSARAEMEKSMSGNLFKGLGDAFLSAIQVQWGWLPLLAGSFLVIAAGTVAPEMLKEDQTPVPPLSNRKAYQILGASSLIFFATILVAAYVPLGTSLPPSLAQKKNDSTLTNLFDNSKSPGVSGQIASKPSTSADPEKQNYLQFLQVNKVEIGRTILEEPGVFGEVKNTGNRTLNRVEITIYFLNRQGQPVFEKQFPAVLAGSGTFGRDDKPLKPGYSQKFGVKAEDAPSEWAKTVTVRVTDVEFEQ
ncbi:MAG TPA: hypothetical protein VF656_19015 [Pyrinomonadaceae bacterium]|jgi:hypothetical protein